MKAGRRTILVHGFGTYAIVYRHMIALAKSVAPDVEWAMILPSSHHMDAIHSVIEPDRVLCLENERARRLPELTDLAELAGYYGSIYADIEVEKQVYKHRPAHEQLTRAAEAYRIYKKFVQRINPTHVLMAHVETFEGKALVAIAGELNIPLMVPSELRNLGGMMLSPDTGEGMPVYRRAGLEHLAQARKFISEFRHNPKPATNPDLFSKPGEQPLPLYLKPLPQRVWGTVTRILRNPRMFEPALLSTSFKLTFPQIRDTIRGIRAYWNKRCFDISGLNSLPDKFIYYPLQTTPESSINTPAPYYIDQMRAIDAIRLAMPSDHVLVVKEHWASVGVRPPSFYAVLSRKAGIRIAHYSMSSIDLIRRARLTISVTGSATLEAFLLGCPSLVLGRCFVSQYLGGVCGVQELPHAIVRVSQNPPSDEAVVNALAEIYSVRYECVFRPADEPGFYGNRPANIRRLLAAILDHADRLEPYQRRAVAASS